MHEHDAALAPSSCTRAPSSPRLAQRTKVVELLAAGVPELSVLLRVLVLQLDELQHQRTASHDARASRQEVAPHDGLQHRTLARALRAQCDEARSQAVAAWREERRSPAPKRPRTWPPTTTMVESLFHSTAFSVMAVSPSVVHICCSLVISWVTFSIAPPLLVVRAPAKATMRAWS